MPLRLWLCVVPCRSTAVSRARGRRRGTGWHGEGFFGRRVRRLGRVVPAWQPFRNGGTDPTGFDCSGLVQFVFGQSGLALPRSVREQMRLGIPVPAGEVEPGDLLFFAIDGRTVSHVAIAVGLDRFVHAPSTRGVVREERLSADYWSRRFSGARRIEN
ncbi:MAG: NlpC/P60 family protein [Acidobacteria bacterium]|nr:MAG: NlpC/P60 family protein [Acidobacteriota bacterium]